MTSPTPTRWAEVTKGAAALLALAGLVAGVPVGLWRLVGWPLPHTLPTWHQLRTGLADTYIPDQILFNTLAIVCWIIWALLILCLTVETLAVARGRVAARIPLAGPLQDTAARLIATVTLLGALSGFRHAPAIAAPALPHTGPTTPTTAPLSPQPASEATTVTPTPAPASLPVYVVRPRDDLWSIAQRHLGDPYRWRDIWEHNQGRRQPDGAVFTDPDLIRPGWTLRLPADATGLSAPARPGPPQTSQTGPDAFGEPAVPNPGAPSAHQPPPATPTPPPSEQATARQPAGVPAAADHATRPHDNEPVDASGSEDDQDCSADPWVQLPSGALVGLSLAVGVSTALAAARLHQRRRRQPGDPQPGIAYHDPLAPEAVRRLRRAHLAHLDTGADSAPAPLLDQPGHITIGHRDGQPVTLNLASIGGVGLTGPGALDVARALIVDFLDHPQPGIADVILTSPTLADDLLPGLQPVPGLDIADSLEVALTRLEVELITRTRLLDTDQAPDFTTYTRRHPEDPLPALLLVTADPDPVLTARLTAVLALGRRLGITALILGDQATVPTLTVGPDGHIDTATPHSELTGLGNVRLCTLPPVEATHVVAVIAASRTPHTAPTITEAEREPFPVPVSASQAQSKPLTVHLLGPYRIHAAGGEIRAGLRSKARELLAYLLLHPHGATLEATVEALWPDADPTRGVERFRTVLANLRTTLRSATGQPDAAVIARVGPRYHADPDLIDCDLWHFQTALADASSAGDHTTAIHSLQQVAAAYNGDLLDSCYYDWVEPIREDLRRRATDALARLGELHEQTGNPEAALTALEQAIRHDPYAEQLYQRIMRLQATLGRPDAARRTYRLLETRLADLDVDPDQTTTQLLTELSQQPAHPSHAAAHRAPQ
jgi:DNA-binding SARP family transcriptional activator